MATVFVVSAPSGTGKTTLNNRLTNEYPQIEIAISHTTRQRRVGEVDGASYHFVSKEYFQSMIHHHEMIEWAEVFGNLYGTSKSEIDRISAKGHHVILEIDVQGCQTIVKDRTNIVTVFILPPSIEALWQRLEHRGTDKLEDRWRRICTAKKEIECGHFYEHFIVNEHVEKAYKELKGVIVEGKHSSISHSDGMKRCQQLIREFDSSELMQDLKKKFGGD